ncbi:PREDICTED: LOC110773232 [Prunus dulcis]|uniref:PREDICTED: LOC110773232 n=1 Tax=Prunus dulcis TaxID=3755 RepID=A0A5E4ENB9_PRUDU|nr:hypothetical protein L3X38_002527 [Prunus dulcis]VVA16896.1 PREDICTED: LOC110773232 [Prunus dulcis]
MSRAKKVANKGASSSRSAPQSEAALLTASAVTERNVDLNPSIQSTELIQPRDNQTVPIKVRGKNVDLSPSIISDVLNLPGEDTDEWNRYLGRDFNLQDAAERLFYADPTAFASQTKKTVLTQDSGVRVRSNDIIAKPMGPILDTSVSKSISQRRDATRPAPVLHSMPPPQPHTPTSSLPFPLVPSVDTSAWDPSLRAIWDMQMIQYQQMQRMSSSIDAIWTHLQMPGQPESAAGDDDDDDE